MGGDQSLQYTIVKVGYADDMNSTANISTDND